jgi:hypothetical protein
MGVTSAASWLLLLLLTAGALLAAANGTASRRILQDAAPPLAEPAGQCCERLDAISFSSNLPVVVLETGGQKIKDKGVDTDVQLCTCNSGRWGGSWRVGWFQVGEFGGKRRRPVQWPNSSGWPAFSLWLPKCSAVRACGCGRRQAAAA